MIILLQSGVMNVLQMVGKIHNLLIIMELYTYCIDKVIWNEDSALVRKYGATYTAVVSGREIL